MPSINVSDIEDYDDYYCFIINNIPEKDGHNNYCCALNIDKIYTKESQYVMCQSTHRYQDDTIVAILAAEVSIHAYETPEPLTYGLDAKWPLVAEVEISNDGELAKGPTTVKLYDTGVRLPQLWMDLDG